MNETIREAFYCSKCHCNTTRFINSGKTLCQKCLLKDEARHKAVKDVLKVINDSVHYYEAIKNRAWLKWNIRRLVLGIKEPEPKELEKELSV